MNAQPGHDIIIHGSRQFTLATLAVCVVLNNAAPAFAVGAGAGNSEPSASPSFDGPATSDETVQLYVTAASYGALTGIWVNEFADGGSATRWLSGFGAAGLGVGATALLDASNSLTLGLPQALVTDALIGFEIGAAWAWHFRAGAEASEEPTTARQLTLLWGGATAGAALGGLRYALSPSNPGRAAFTGTATLWAGAVSALVAGAFTDRPSRRDDNASLALALGLEGGVLLASFAGRSLQPSLGWVRALDVGAVVGGSLVGGGYLLVSGGKIDDCGTLAAGAAGIGAGLAAAVLLAPRLGLPKHTSFVLAPDVAIGAGHLGVKASGSF